MGKKTICLMACITLLVPLLAEVVPEVMIAEKKEKSSLDDIERSNEKTEGAEDVDSLIKNSKKN